MVTLNEWLNEHRKFLSDTSDIEAIIMGDSGWGNRYNIDDFVGKYIMGKTYSYDEIKDVLDIEFDSGRGAPACPTIVIYSHDYIYSVYQYDGSTRMFSVPRNPIEGYMPSMPGG